jgi:hypothetical protein
VKERVGPLNYRIAAIGSKVTQVVHVENLKEFKERLGASTKEDEDTTPHVELEDMSLSDVEDREKDPDWEPDDTNVYEVKKVLAHKVEKGIVYFHLEWKAGGFQWVPEADLNCPDLVRKYFATIGSKDHRVDV